MKDDSMPLSRRVFINALKGVALILLLLLILWGRVLYGSMQNYKTGETLLKQNQTIRALTYFDRALHWYAPLNPYAEKAVKRLWEIGEQAEKEGDLNMARFAFESIRNAAYGATHVFTPSKDWIERAELKIHELATGKRQGEKGRIESYEFGSSPHPHGLWSLAVVLGFFGWVGSLAGFVRWVLGKDKRSAGVLRRPLLWVSLFLFFFGWWVLGMVLA